MSQSCCEKADKKSAAMCVLCGTPVCGHCQKFAYGKLTLPTCKNCFTPAMDVASAEDRAPADKKDVCEFHDSPSSEPCGVCADVICKNCRKVFSGRHVCAACREKMLVELRAQP